jgi:hypothetical protein
LRYPVPATLVVLLTAGLLLSGCDNGDSPTTPSPNPTETQTFTGSLTRNGSQTHSFLATAQGTVTATITAIDPATSPAIGFSMGTWDGTNCLAVVSNNAATLSSAHTGTVVGITSLCVRLFDASGTIPADQPVGYTVTVQYPVEP